MARRKYLRLPWRPIDAWSVLVAMIALIAITTVDLSLPEKANISGALVVVPFLAAITCPPRRVVVLGAVAILAAIGLAFADGSGPHASAARLFVIVIGTAVAFQMSVLRLRRERALIDISAIAEVAQHAIISQPRPVVGALAIAVRYQSSTRAATVGGDCFEALDTSFGTRLLLGDVRGHGLPAVGLSALVVGAFRTLAHFESGLSSVVRGLDHLVAQRTKDANREDGLDGEEFVTAVLMEVNQGQVTMANCGHPPPLLLRPDGHVTVLEATTPALPLAFGSEPELEIMTLEPGARILLYTDGIIESRDRHGAFFDLHGAVSEVAAEPLEAMLDALIEKLKHHADNQILDDVALLAFERLPEPLDNVEIRVKD